MMQWLAIVLLSVLTCVMNNPGQPLPARPAPGNSAFPSRGPHAGDVLRLRRRRLPPTKNAANTDAITSVEGSGTAVTTRI